MISTNNFAHPYKSKSVLVHQLMHQRHAQRHRLAFLAFRIFERISEHG